MVGCGPCRPVPGCDPNQNAPAERRDAAGTPFVQAQVPELFDNALPFRLRCRRQKYRRRRPPDLELRLEFRGQLSLASVPLDQFQRRGLWLRSLSRHRRSDCILEQPALNACTLKLKCQILAVTVLRWANADSIRTKKATFLRLPDQSRPRNSALPAKYDVPLRRTY